MTFESGVIWSLYGLIAFVVISAPFRLYKRVQDGLAERRIENIAAERGAPVAQPERAYLSPLHHAEIIVDYADLGDVLMPANKKPQSIPEQVAAAIERQRLQREMYLAVSKSLSTWSDFEQEWRRYARWENTATTRSNVEQLFKHDEDDSKFSGMGWSKKVMPIPRQKSPSASEKIAR